ncbi:hypothetical protein RB213_005271 [Colletotrichum asianum]|uniref:Uncharacterized protein n=1 Tax=Colletotrichum asianum TaxID=702518 RepID=A0A8H3W2H9_9PEZI|nr:hypothetical protein GQ607_014121 [Colletotrichum asianum]
MANKLGAQNQRIRTEISSTSNMGRGAYDTTGVPKPPPRPKPR